MGLLCVVVIIYVYRALILFYLLIFILLCISCGFNISTQFPVVVLVLFLCCGLNSHIISNSSFIYHPNIWRSIVRDADDFEKRTTN
jgi:hypothetical protein